VIERHRRTDRRRSLRQPAVQRQDGGPLGHRDDLRRGEDGHRPRPHPRGGHLLAHGDLDRRLGAGLEARRRRREWFGHADTLSAVALGEEAFVRP